MALEAKVRKQAQRRAKDAPAPVVRPDAVAETAAEHALVAETERNMKVMRKTLSQLGSVDAFELVYNGASFAQTVENIFTLSFLVKDGLVRLSKGQRGGVVAQLASRPEPADFASRSAEVMQFVLRLGVADWDAARERMPLEPRIPHRARITEHAGGATQATQAAATQGADAGEDDEDDDAPIATKRGKGKKRVAREESEEEEDGEDDEPIKPKSKRR